jgi:hypothetical protein
MTVTSSGDHVFGRVRPSHNGGFQLNGKTVRVTTFGDLPPPSGAASYHLDLRDIIPASAYEELVTTNKLVFHLNGDIVGIDFAAQQHLVAAVAVSVVHTRNQPDVRKAYLAAGAAAVSAVSSRISGERAHCWRIEADTRTLPDPKSATPDAVQAGLAPATMEGAHDAA